MAIANTNGSYYIACVAAGRPPAQRAQNRHLEHKERIVVVCLCHRVSDRDIARAAQQGCVDYDSLQEDLRVATSCGSCDDCAREVFEACARGGQPAACAAAQPAFA